MKKEYLQPFIKASEKVSNEFFDLEVNSSNISIEKTIALDTEVLLILGIRGDLNGVVLFGMSIEEATKIGSYKLEQQGLAGYNDWGEMTQSVIKEFGNQVVGYVTRLYENEGFKCDITTPTFVKPEHINSIKKKSVRFEMDNGIANMVLKLHINGKD